MLNQGRVLTFVPVSDVDRAMHFYSDVLGLVVTDCSDSYCALDAGGVTIRLTLVVDRPAVEHTIVGWSVPDLNTIAAELVERGLTFHRYDGMDQDQYGAWVAPNGDHIAWFSDPDGNILSLTQFANVPATTMA